MGSTKAKSSLKLTEVNDFKRKEHFDAVAERAARRSLIKWPLDKTIGLEPKYGELCEYFEMDEVGIIGVSGMGGVGKTTLLKKFYNEFLPTTQHDIVIWVEGAATKEGDVAKIQEIIKTQLNIRDDIWKDYIYKAILLHRILKSERFVLILDGVGVQFDLSELGIPQLNDGRSKVILTTRCEHIFGWMGARKFVRVDILTHEKAFELFKEKAGEDVISSNRRIKKLAKLMSDECEGLPLALIVVGKYMACKTSIGEWEWALETLKRYPSRFPGMVDQVYRLLEFSYHGLPDEIYKSCFLYCSLFPKDYNMDKEELILLWIAEGFFAKYYSDLYHARNEGHCVIFMLEQALLLEVEDTERYVKMHNIIRHTALWLACEHESKMRFIVKDNAVTCHTIRWEDVEKLSLWGSAWGRGPTLQSFFKKCHCSNLLTLLMRNFSEQDFEAFDLPITIKVLDMPDNKSSGSLLSTIGMFVNLEYLNVSNSWIIKLPEQLRELKNLRYLLLNDITHLEFPRQGVVCNLSSLEAFSMLRSCYDGGVLLDELESLQHLQDFRISIHSYSSFEKILMSRKLRRCICDLEASCVFDKNSLQTFGEFLGAMIHLETLVIDDKSNPSLEGSQAENCLRGLFQGLEHGIPLGKLTISKWKIFGLDWLKFARDLQHLELLWCDLLEEIVNEDCLAVDGLERYALPGLTTLILKDLPRLKSICGRALKFPCLEVVIVRGCPNLRKLPFNCHSQLKNLKCFKGERDWVDQLEWEDEVTKNLLVEKFEPF